MFFLHIHTYISFCLRRHSVIWITVMNCSSEERRSYIGMTWAWINDYKKIQFGGNNSLIKNFKKLLHLARNIIACPKSHLWCNHMLKGSKPIQSQKAHGYKRLFILRFCRSVWQQKTDYPVLADAGLIRHFFQTGGVHKCNHRIIVGLDCLLKPLTIILLAEVYFSRLLIWNQFRPIFL